MIGAAAKRPTPETRSPGLLSLSRATMRRAASATKAGSTPREKRAELSLNIKFCCWLLRTAMLSKLATSSSTAVVASVTRAAYPPITPASATIWSSATMTGQPSGTGWAAASASASRPLKASPARDRRTPRRGAGSAAAS